MLAAANLHIFKNQLNPVLKDLVTHDRSVDESGMTVPERSAMEAYLVMADIFIDSADTERWSDADFELWLRTQNDVFCALLDRHAAQLDSEPSAPASWDVLHALHTAHELASAGTRMVAALTGKAKALHASQGAANEEVRRRAQALQAVVERKTARLKAKVDESGWIDRVIQTVTNTGEDASGGDDTIAAVVEPLAQTVDEGFLEAWAGDVVESWRESTGAFALLRRV